MPNDPGGAGLPPMVANIGGVPLAVRGFADDPADLPGLPYHRRTEFLVLPTRWRVRFLLRNPTVRRLARTVCEALADAPAAVPDPHGVLRVLPPAPCAAPWERCGRGSDEYRAGMELKERFAFNTTDVVDADGDRAVKFWAAAGHVAADDRAAMLHGPRALKRQFVGTLNDRRAAAGLADRRTPPDRTLARVLAV